MGGEYVAAHMYVCTHVCRHVCVCMYVRTGYDVSRQASRQLCGCLMRKGDGTGGGSHGVEGWCGGREGIGGHR